MSAREQSAVELIVGQLRNSKIELEITKWASNERDRQKCSCAGMG